jgi:hypothetical protein
VLALEVIPTHIGGHVGEHAVFPQVIANHLRHVCVNHLVIRHSSPGGIGQGNPSGFIHLHESWDAQERIGSEGPRIKKIIIDTSIDDIHPL